MNQSFNPLNTKADWASDRNYLDCVQDLLEHDVMEVMHAYPHHGTYTCFEHSLAVSFRSYKLAKRFGLDARSAARGGLLHDLYLYDRYEAVRVEHRFNHAQTALTNADRYFALTNIEEDIIKKHMWPLNLAFPKYKESYIVTMMDKYSALVEFLQMDHQQLVEEFGQLTAVKAIRRWQGLSSCDWVSYDGWTRPNQSYLRNEEDHLLGCHPVYPLPAMVLSEFIVD